MKKILLVLLIVHCSLLFAEAQWIKQFSPNHDLSDIEFIDRNTGWACGGNYIYKTTNGGITWVEQIHPDGYLIQQIHPVNDRVVYAAGWWNFMKTTDGGENWFSLFDSIPPSQLPELEGLYFINENTGWLVGNVVAMKTTNGGNSFVDSMRIEEISQDVYFKDSLNGILCGYSGGFRKTTDGGKTWNRIQILNPGTLYSFYRLSVFNDSLVWVGSKPVYRSTDFGTTWDSIGHYPFSEINNYVYNINFSSAMTGYAGGASRQLFKTTDGGFNWIPQQTSQYSPGLYLGMFALNDSIVWACGRRIILQTQTGGQTNISNLNTYFQNNYFLSQNYPNPFNPETTIGYELTISGLVTLKIFDILGNEITTLVDKKQSAGRYELSLDGNRLSSGVYFYSLFINNILINTRKMLLLK